MKHRIVNHMLQGHLRVRSEILGARAEIGEVLAVEAADGGAVRVTRVGDADHVLRLAAVAVLGAEDDLEAHALGA